MRSPALGPGRSRAGRELLRKLHHMVDGLPGQEVIERERLAHEALAGFVAGRLAEHVPDPPTSRCDRPSLIVEMHDKDASACRSSSIRSSGRRSARRSSHLIAPPMSPQSKQAQAAVDIASSRSSRSSASVATAAARPSASGGLVSTAPARARGARHCRPVAVHRSLAPSTSGPDPVPRIKCVASCPSELSHHPLIPVRKTEKQVRCNRRRGGCLLLEQTGRVPVQRRPRLHRNRLIGSAAQEGVCVSEPASGS